MVKKFFMIFNFFVFGLTAFSVSAVCPVCIAGVGAGVGLCRWLKIDDLVSGIWIGGLIASIFLWFLNWLEKKNINFKFRDVSVFAISYLLIIVPLYFSEIIGHPLNRIWGVDKLLLGIITGTLVFLLGVWFHRFLKKRNQGKSYFPFQMVVVPISLLIIASLIFYYVNRCQI